MPICQYIFADWHPARIGIIGIRLVDWHLMNEQIEKTLEEIRPMLALHKGNVEFVKFEDGVVYVKLLGTCQGCPLSQLTLKSGIEEMLKSKINGVDRVEAV